MGDMAAELIPILVPGVVGLAMFVAGGITLILRSHAQIRVRLTEGGASASVICESCSVRFEMPVGEIASAKFTHAPYMQLTKKVIKPSVVHGIPSILGVEKAVRSKHYYECPMCHEKAWLRVEDPEQFYRALQSVSGEGAQMLLLLPWGFVCLLLMAGLSAILKLLF